MDASSAVQYSLCCMDKNLTTLSYKILEVLLLLSMEGCILYLDLSSIMHTVFLFCCEQQLLGSSPGWLSNIVHLEADVISFLALLDF